MIKAIGLILAVLWGGLCQAAEFSVIRQYAYPLIIMNSNNSQHIASPVGSGTMVMISDGYALTAGHVVPTSSNNVMVAIVGDKIVKVVPVKIDRVQDIALLSVQIQCPCAPLASRAPQLDDTVHMVGHPLTLSYGVQFVTSGTFQGYFNGVAVTTTLTAPGGSGGGVFMKQNGAYVLTGLTIAIGSDGSDKSLLSNTTQYDWVVFSVTTLKIVEFLKGTNAIPIK